MNKLMTGIFMIAVLACNTDNRSEGETVEANKYNEGRVIDSASDFAGCYLGILNRDSAYLVLQHEEDARSVSGDLTYANYERDSRKGTFRGKIQDSMINAYYTYSSEGTRSVEQIVLKINGNELLQGYGDVEQVGDTVKFKDISQLSYLAEKPFKKVDCK